MRGDGTPLSSTTYLNRLKFMLTMALLHHRGDQPRWASLLSRIGHRNLIQLPMEPDLSQTLGLAAFDRVFQGADREKILFG